MSKPLFLFILLAILAIACQNESSSSPPPVSMPMDTVSEAVLSHHNTVETTIVSDKKIVDTNLEDKPPHKSSNSNSSTTIEEDNHPIANSSKGDYAWLENYNATLSLEQQIPVPAGYKRVDNAEGSFAAWLRGLPLKSKGAKVMLHNGDEKSYQAGAYQVVDIDIGSRDLQQCADAVMRLKAEYHYSLKDYKNIHFNYTSGHTIRFSDWATGKKPVLKNSKVVFSSSNGKTDHSYKNFKKYLTNVYCYAGTASLSKELSPKKVTDITAGDVFIWGGFPGHAILVLDVAQHQETGKKIFLVAQSYMPAQSIHILKNFNQGDISPWYSEDFGSELITPEWTFDRNALKAF